MFKFKTKKLNKINFNKKMFKLFRIILAVLFVPVHFFIAQDEWDFDSPKKNKPLFLDTRAINGHSVNVLEKKVMELRITHRFGEIGTNESYRTLFGMDNSSDIRIGFEYGINDKLMVGGGRSKGASPYSEFWDGLIKWNLYANDKKPLKITYTSQMFFTSMRSSGQNTELNNYSKFINRFSYNHQILIAFKPIEKLTLQLSPGFSYRNLVNYQDDNLIGNLSAVIRLHLYKKVSLIAEYYANRNITSYRKNNFVNPFGIGIEINTFGHVFLLNFVNSKGIGEGQFIPYTSSKWNRGEFRFGFTIARKFNK
jgi:hypothetical protein